MPGIDFQAVRTLVSVAEVLRLLQFVPRGVQGEQVRGACPSHGSTSPRTRSFSANLRKNTYRCFKCGSAGNQLDLWAAATKLPLHKAASDLCRKLDVPIPWIHRW